MTAERRPLEPGLAWAKAIFALVAFVLPATLLNAWLPAPDQTKEPDRWVESGLLGQFAGCVVLLVFAAFVRPSATWQLSVRQALRTGAAYLCFLVPWMLAVLAYSWLLREIGKPIQAQPHLMYFTHTHAPLAPFLLTLLTVCVVQPLAEEVLFRGYATDALCSVLGTRLGDVAGALVFGAIHGAQQALPVALLGLLFAALRRQSGSLAPSSLAHALHNSSMVLLAAYEPRLLAR